MNIYDNQYLKLKETKLLEIINGVKNVTEISEELDVGRQAIYEWLARYKRFGIEGLVHRKKLHKQSPVNKTSKEIEEKVIALAKKYFVDGVETLHDKLEYEHNISLDPVTIWRILKRTNTRYQDNYTMTQRNWIKQLYAHEMAGQEVQIDTFFPFGYKQGKVVYTAIDDASRYVYAKIYSTRNKENTMDFLNELIKRFPFRIQKIRMDQGKEFKNYLVNECLKMNNILIRYNTPYCPEENGKIERFHKTFKHKALPYGFYPDISLDYFQYKLTLFLFYYNFIKKHKGLGMDNRTPIQKLHNLKVQV